MNFHCSTRAYLVGVVFEVASPPLRVAVTGVDPTHDLPGMMHSMRCIWRALPARINSRDDKRCQRICAHPAIQSIMFIAFVPTGTPNHHQNYQLQNRRFINQTFISKQVRAQTLRHRLRKLLLSALGDGRAHCHANRIETALESIQPRGCP